MPIPRSAWFSVAASAMLAVASCLPIPHSEMLAPSLTGHYRDDGGLPVAGAVVAVSVADDDTTCVRPSATATTGADGAFVLPAIRRRESYTLLLPVDEVACFSVCGGRGGAPLRAGYSACRLNRGSGNLELDCTERRGTVDVRSLQCAAPARRQRAITE